MDSYDWQTKMSSIKERNFHALNNSLFCDVELSVVDSNGEKVTIHVHKYVLAIGSPVFQAMFYGKMAESRQVVELRDCTKEGVQELLHYLYTDEVDLTGSNVMEILLLADRYMLPFLVEKCNNYLEKELKPEDVFSVLPQVEKIDNKKALKLCWEMIDTHTKRAVSSQPFLSISHKLLSQVLGRESLHVGEIELFKAVDRWSSFNIENETKKGKEKKLTKRAVLGDEVVKLIRFPVMSQTEFATHVLSTDILLKGEVVEMMQIFSSVEPRQRSFNNMKRNGQEREQHEQWSEVRYPNPKTMCHADRFSTSYTWSTPVNPQHGPACIDFQVNKRISLAGVRLFGALGHRYKVIIDVYSSNYSYGYHSNDGFNESFVAENNLTDGLNPGFTVKINPPFQLEPGKRYTIKADIKGPTYYQNVYNLSRGKTTLKCGDVKITIMNSSEDWSGTTIDGGQFPAFLLKWA